MFYKQIIWLCKTEYYAERRRKKCSGVIDVFPSVLYVRRTRLAYRELEDKYRALMRLARMQRAKV